MMARRAGRWPGSSFPSATWSCLSSRCARPGKRALSRATGRQRRARDDLRLVGRLARLAGIAAATSPSGSPPSADDAIQARTSDRLRSRRLSRSPRPCCWPGIVGGIQAMQGRAADSWSGTGSPVAIVSPRQRRDAASPRRRSPRRRPCRHKARPPAVKREAPCRAARPLAAPARRPPPVSVPVTSWKLCSSSSAAAGRRPASVSAQLPPATAGTIQRKMRRPSSSSSASGRQSPMWKSWLTMRVPGRNSVSSRGRSAQIDPRQQIEGDDARLADRRLEQVLAAEDGRGSPPARSARALAASWMRTGSRSTPSARAPRRAAAIAIRPSPQPRSIR